jgi:hypothetical protein
MTAPLFGIVLLAASLAPGLLLVGLLSADTAWTVHQREMARLTAPLAPAREDLTEPAKRVPGATLADVGPAPDSEPTPSDVLLYRIAAGLRGLDSERVSDEYHGRHRYEVGAVGSAAQQAGLRALREPTGEFDVLVRANWDTGEREALSWRCDVCRGVVAEGERPHDHCQGCGCPCTTAEPALIGRPPLVGAR